MPTFSTFLTTILDAYFLGNSRAIGNISANIPPTTHNCVKNRTIFFAVFVFIVAVN